MRHTVFFLALAACGGPGPSLVDAGAGGDAPASHTITIHTYTRADLQAAASADAPWVGGQDGDGTFAMLSSSAPGTYTLAIHDARGRYGVAVACATGVEIVHAIADEGTDVVVTCGASDPPLEAPRTLDTRNCQASQVAIAATTAIGPSQVQQVQVLEGRYDVLGVCYAAGVPDKVLVERGVDATDVIVDFASADAQPAAIGQVTVSGDAEWTYRYLSSAGVWFGNYFGTGTYPGFSAAARAPGDIHSLCVIGGACHWFADPIDIDDTNVPPAAVPSVTASGETFTWQTYLASGFRISLGGWTAYVSAGWLDGATTYTLPHLCDVTGFPTRCAPTQAGAPWYFATYKPVGGFVASLVDIANAEQLSTAARDGLTYNGALAQGTL